MKKIFFIILAIEVANSDLFAQQDVQFSQYVFNGLTINPAYAGYKGNWYAQAFYRQQWVGFPGAPKSGGISLDGLTNTTNNTIGLGGQILWEKLGPQESISLFADYAYRIQLDRADTRRLCFGIAAGATQYALDGTKLELLDPNDPDASVGKISRWILDAKFGVYYYTPSWYLGVSALDLFAINGDRKIYYSSGQETVTLRKSAHLYLTAGTVIPLSDNVKLKPSFLWKEDFKGPSALDINVFALLAERLWIGGSYRTNMKIWKNHLQDGLAVSTAGSVLLEFYVTSEFRIGYSYDIALNGLAGYQSGSHEISIGVTLPNKRVKEWSQSPRYF